MHHRPVDRWFYIGMAIAAILTAIAGFGPSIINTAARKAPLTPLAEAHAIANIAWLLLFLAQTTLVATRRIAAHRRLGVAASRLAVALVVLGYTTCIAMARRGFDLSGDLNAEADPLGPQFLFPLSNLAEFSTLLAAGYWFRHRAEIHKRLMLLATVGGLMPAPLAHLIGHFPSLRDMGAIIVVPFAAFLFASAVYDRVSRGRIHPVSMWGRQRFLSWGF